MRIISGKYKGKKILGYNIDGTRPTMDRIKESIFSMIQNNIKDKICLDLFAGSGSFALECISNYSKKTYIVDKNEVCLKYIKNNLKNINEDYELLNLDYKDSLLYFKNKNIKFDLIFLDPPYKSDLINTAIKIIEQDNLLNENGLLVIEYEKYNIYCNYKEYKHKKYGNKEVKIYKNF